ncbi:MAG: hypothetical protein ACLP59_20695 [Bryobacteraceae bacterium]
MYYQRNRSKTILHVLATLAFCAAFAATASAQTTTQHWTPGWGISNERLNYSKSTIVWSVSATDRLTVTYKLVSAVPNKLYQVGLTIFCTTFPATFGQFPTDTNDGNCIPNFLQGVNATAAAVELGVVLTDDVGTGSVKIVVGPITPGTYTLEFDARDGAGCLVTGGGDDCLIDFQSPGPFGTATQIVVP